MCHSADNICSYLSGMHRCMGQDQHGGAVAISFYAAEAVPVI